MLIENRSLPDYALVKREASELLRKYGYSEPPINPVDIARKEGFDVKFARFTGEFEGVSGFFDPTKNTIFVNKDEYPLRQTFTVAHELAHAKLHCAWANSDDYKIFWRDMQKNDRADPHEKEANAFAAQLLVPRSMLDLYYRNLDAANLSRLFAVSVPVIEHRLAFEYGI